MPDEEWDGILYVDEAMYYPRIPKDKEKRIITMIGAGVGRKKEDTELLDWCALAFYYENGLNGGHNGNKRERTNSNGYWVILGEQCFQMIAEEYARLKPGRIYICNQIAFYVMQAAATAGLGVGLSERKFEKLLKSMKPVTHREYKNRNIIYKTKQEVGKKVRKKLKLESIAPEDRLEILQGRLYDMKYGCIIDMKNGRLI